MARHTASYCIYRSARNALCLRVQWLKTIVAVFGDDGVDDASAVMYHRIRWGLLHEESLKLLLPEDLHRRGNG